VDGRREVGGGSGSSSGSAINGALAIFGICSGYGINMSVTTQHGKCLDGER